MRVVISQLIILTYISAGTVLIQRLNLYFPLCYILITAISADYRPSKVCHYVLSKVFEVDAVPYKNYCATWAFCYMLFYMHPRNSEILNPVMRAYGNKNREQSEKSCPTDASRRDQNPPRPRQLSLLGK